jgi:hypothetical protein
LNGKEKHKVSSNQPETDDVIIIGVPAITKEAKNRFARPPSERQVRYWLERQILRGKRMQSLWTIGRRNLHKQIDEFTGK